MTVAVQDGAGGSPASPNPSFSVPPAASSVGCPTASLKGLFFPLPASKVWAKRCHHPGLKQREGFLGLALLFLRRGAAGQKPREVLPGTEASSPRPLAQTIFPSSDFSPSRIIHEHLPEAAACWAVPGAFHARRSGSPSQGPLGSPWSLPAASLECEFGTLALPSLR